MWAAPVLCGRGPKGRCWRRVEGLPEGTEQGLASLLGAGSRGRASFTHRLWELLGTAWRLEVMERWRALWLCSDPGCHREPPAGSDRAWAWLFSGLESDVTPGSMPSQGWGSDTRSLKARD